jgi:hypothetical protein
MRLPAYRSTAPAAPGTLLTWHQLLAHLRGASS